MEIKLNDSFTQEEVSELDLDKIMWILTGKKSFKWSVCSKISREGFNWLKIPYFRLFFWSDDLGFHAIVKTAWDWMGTIFKHLVLNNKKKWLEETEAVREASKTLIDFYTACQSASDNHEYPFRVVVKKRTKKQN